MDACICRETCARQTHASLAQEMHAPKSFLGTRITCVFHRGVYMHPNCTLINNFSIQMLQSTQGMTPRTRTTDPDVCNSLGARISQTQRCTRQAHACLGARISCLPQIHAYSKVRAPMGVILACCCQNHLQLGVLFSQRSMLGVLPPQEPMNTPVSSSRTFYKTEKQTKKTQVISGLCNSARSFYIPGA